MSNHVDIGAILMKQGDIEQLQEQLDEAYAELGRLAFRVAEANGMRVLALIEELAKDEVQQRGDGD